MTELNKEKEFKERVDKALSSELISYIASYRSLGLNKAQAILCMVELDKRRQNGDTIQYEVEIDNQTQIISSIGKGFVVQTFDGAPLDTIIKSIRDYGIPCMVYNRELGLAHIGIASQEDQLKISNIPGIKEIIRDRKVLHNALSSKISDDKQDFGGSL
jgi:hypothetical protein